MSLNFVLKGLSIRYICITYIGMLFFIADLKAQEVKGTEKVQGESKFLDNQKLDGYRGIWWFHPPMKDRPQSPSYGSTDYKYSGPLSFAWPHTVAPMAIYAPEVNKTFFVYGGDSGPENRYLLAMVSYYDHNKHRVPKPTVVRDQRGVDDPHDNPSISIDDEGYLWIFVAGRGRHRPGQIFRSNEPYSIDSFELVIEREQTYSQIWRVPQKGFFHLLTLYTSGRELYFETNKSGKDWEPNPADKLQKLVGFGGHYQVSRVKGDTIGTAFNYHPEGNVDRRTNLYYLQTTDFGKTWTTADGTPVQIPLEDRDNPALINDYEAQGKNVYPNQLLFDNEGRPVILYITSFGAAPVPENAPRAWKIRRWTGEKWVSQYVTVSDHAYDEGAFYIHDDRWTLIAPAVPGPQPGYNGGEIGIFETTDPGNPDNDFWQLKRQVTRNSPFNHGYVRRPHNPKDPFFAMWADSDPKKSSISRIFFSNSRGDRVYMLPYEMDEDFAEPILLNPPTPTEGEDTFKY
mgnify:CR=1 FL=1